MTDTDNGRDRETVGETQRRLRNVGEGREARKRCKKRGEPDAASQGLRAQRQRGSGCSLRRFCAAVARPALPRRALL